MTLSGPLSCNLPIRNGKDVKKYDPADEARAELCYENRCWETVNLHREKTKTCNSCPGNCTLIEPFNALPHANTEPDLLQHSQISFAIRLGMHKSCDDCLSLKIEFVCSHYEECCRPSNTLFGVDERWWEASAICNNNFGSLKRMINNILINLILVEEVTWKWSLLILSIVSRFLWTLCWFDGILFHLSFRPSFVGAQTFPGLRQVTLSDNWMFITLFIRRSFRWMCRISVKTEVRNNLPCCEQMHLQRNVEMKHSIRIGGSSVEWCSELVMSADVVYNYPPCCTNPLHCQQSQVGQQSRANRHANQAIRYSVFLCLFHSVVST